MPLMARSDLVSVSVSRDHGGCGARHDRPVTEGAPEKLWTLTCPQCTGALKSDPLWAGSEAEIPETPDEVKAREDREKRGERARDGQVATALEKLAAMPDAFETLTKILAGNMLAQQGALDAPVALCRDGHQNPSSARFCGECGVSMAEAAGSARSAPEPVAVAAAPAPANGGRRKPMKDWRAEDLQAEARRLGLDDSGTRREVLERIKSAAREAA